MDHSISSRVWAILGSGIAVAAGLGLLLVFLGRGPDEPAPMITPAIPTPSDDPAVPYVPVAQSPLVTPATSPLPTPTAGAPAPSPFPVPATVPPSPTPALAIPEIAPDFTLTGAKGTTLTLSEQLVHGPVVLVFFQRGGG